MEPQTPQPTAQTPGISQQNSGASNVIDPTALTLSRAIRQVESQGNYNAIGDNGTSWGAYQWHGNNFQTWAQQYGLNPEDTSETNQDHLAYLRIKSFLDQGVPPSQVAAIWNGATYQNGQYQAINPSYVSKVQRAYTNIASNPSYGSSNGLGALTPQPQQSTTGANVPNPSTMSQTPQGPSALQTIGGDISQGNLLGAAGQTAKSLFNFAFPIVGDLVNDVQGKDDKTALQQLGDAGMSALWFLPFGDIAEGLGAAGEAAGLGEGAAKAAGVIGTGLGTGYASDVSSNLSQGKTGLAAAQPGLGTAIGGGLGVAGLAAGSLYNKFLGEQNVVDRVQQAYEDAAGATKTGIKGMSKTAAKGLEDNPSFLANAGIPPETEEINGRRVFTTGADSASQKTIQQRITNLTNLRDAGIAKSGATVSFDAMRNDMLSQAEKDFSGTALDSAKNQINKEMDALAADPKYAQDAQGNISAADATKIKTYLQGQSAFDAATPSITRQTFRTMSGVVKNAVENAANESGAPGIAEINKLIQQHLDSLDFLNKINGQTVKGGRLGKYLYEGIGATTGEGISNALGGGLLGNLVGPAVGAMAGGKVSDFMQKLAAGGPLSAATLGRMATEDPEIVQKFLQYIGSQGVEQIAPMVQPAQESAGGLIANILKKSPGSTLRSILQ